MQPQTQSSDFISKQLCITILHMGSDIAGLNQTLDSIWRQNCEKEKLHINVISNVKLDVAYGINVISIEHMDAFPHTLYNTLDKSYAELYVLLHSGDTFFGGTFSSVKDIFNAFSHVEWLTGIETIKAKGGYSVIQGNTSGRRWSSHLFYRNIYTSGARHIPASATFWRRQLWDKAVSNINFVSLALAHNDIWQAYMPLAQLYVCDVYFSAAVAGTNRLSLANYNMPEPVEKSTIKKVTEFLYLNNVPYLRAFYRYANKLPQVVRFEHKSQSYFLSDY